jgi:hypothetical protein
MAGKDKPLKDAVKALAEARDAFAKADDEQSAAAAAFRASDALRIATAQLQAASTAAKVFEDVMDELERMKNPGNGQEFRRMLQGWLKQQKANADAVAATRTAEYRQEETSHANLIAGLSAADDAAREAFRLLREAIAKIPADAVVPAQPARLPDDLLRVIRGGKDERSNYLTINQRHQRFDPLVRDTLGQLGQESRDKFEPELLKKIVAGGLASDIEKITRRINRMGMPDLRRSVLAETYAELLDEALDDGGGPSRERAGDTVGTSEAVMAALDGKLDRFAGVLATRTATALGLDAPDGSYSHSIIKARVLGQI